MEDIYYAIKASVVVIAVLIIVVNSFNTKKRNMSEKIEVLNEDGFLDIIIPIKKMVINKNNDFEVSAKGFHDGKEVGLDAVIKGGMSGGFESCEADTGVVKKESIYINGVILKSLGDPSDRLVGLIVEESNLKNAISFSKKPVGFTCFPLESEQLGVEHPKSHFKLFADKTEAGYAELYFNVDLEERKIEIMEKDPEYRSNIIAVLTSQA